MENPCRSCKLTRAWSRRTGLAFFAILLTQINTINDVIGEKGKVSHGLTAALPMENPYCSCRLTRAPAVKVLVDQKNEVIQFMKEHDLDDDVRGPHPTDCPPKRWP